MLLFISYAHQDFDKIMPFIKWVKHVKHDIWFDDRLQVGDIAWQEQLRRAILKSDAFVYTLTAKSLASQWCQWEFFHAVQLQKPLIPIVFEPDLKLPVWLSQYQYKDISNGLNDDFKRQVKRDLMALSIRLSKDRVPPPPAHPDGKPSAVVRPLRINIDSSNKSHNSGVQIGGDFTGGKVINQPKNIRQNITHIHQNPPRESSGEKWADRAGFMAIGAALMRDVSNKKPPLIEDLGNLLTKISPKIQIQPGAANIQEAMVKPINSNSAVFLYRTRPNSLNTRLSSILGQSVSKEHYIPIIAKHDSDANQTTYFYDDGKHVQQVNGDLMFSLSPDGRYLTTDTATTYSSPVFLGQDAYRPITEVDFSNYTSYAHTFNDHNSIYKEDTLHELVNLLGETLDEDHIWYWDEALDHIDFEDMFDFTDDHDDLDDDFDHSHDHDDLDDDFDHSHDHDDLDDDFDHDHDHDDLDDDFDHSHDHDDLDDDDFT